MNTDQTDIVDTYTHYETLSSCCSQYWCTQQDKAIG